MNILGVDIGGTKIAAGIIDAATGSLLASDRTPTRAREGGPAILIRALELATRVVVQAREDGIAYPTAVGIGAGGQIDPNTGVVLSATEILPGWTGTRLGESFSETFGIPAFADNDVNAFALGEHRFGAAKGASDVIFLALGTGVGGAILIGGKLHRGAHGISGELGHMVIGTDGDRVATLESYACGSALEQHYRALGGSTHLNGYAIGQAAKNDDAAAKEAISRIAVPLGIGLASLANIIDPQLFVIGGGLADLGDLLLHPARQTLWKNALPGARNIPVVTAALGNDSAIIGAACVALTQMQGDSVAG